MKNKILLMVLFLAFLSTFLLEKNPHESIKANHAALIYTTGAPIEKTGAPGESNCTVCHSGNVNDGSNLSSIIFSGSDDFYTAGSTYTMTLTLFNGSPKNGFQLVVLDLLQDNDAGSLIVTDAVNTELIAGTNRTYLNHTFSGTSLTQWDFDWTAPNSYIGPIVFYYAYNVTDNANNAAGDHIYLASDTLQPKIPSLIIDQSNSITFECLPNHLDNTIKVRITSHKNQNATIKLIDISGKELTLLDKFNVYVGDNDLLIEPPVNLTKGLYIINLIVDGKSYTKKFII